MASKQKKIIANLQGRSFGGTFETIDITHLGTAPDSLKHGGVQYQLVRRDSETDDTVAYWYAEI